MKDHVDFAVWLNKMGFTLKDDKGNKRRISTALADYEYEKWMEENGWKKSKEK